MFSKETNCKKCRKRFDIHENRKIKFRGGWSLTDVFFRNRIAMVEEFFHFNLVACPYCGHEFETEDARLFFIFKSPYPIIFIAIALNIIVITLVMIMSKN
jgi:hypothetical protein